MILIFFVGNFVQLPSAIQDGFIHAAFSAVSGYVMIGFLQLYSTSPALLSVPIGITLAVVYLMVRMKRRSAQGTAVKGAVAPDTRECGNGDDEEDYGDDHDNDHGKDGMEEGKANNGHKKANFIITSRHRDRSAARAGGKGRGEVTPFKTRRQSVAEGQKLVDVMRTGGRDEIDFNVSIDIESPPQKHLVSAEQEERENQSEEILSKILLTKFNFKSKQNMGNLYSIIISKTTFC